MDSLYSYATFLIGEDMNGIKLSSPESYSIQSATFSDYSLSEFSHQLKWIPKESDIGLQTVVIKLTDSKGIHSLINHQISVFKNPCIHCDDKNNIAPSDTISN